MNLDKEQLKANEQFFARCVFPLVYGDFEVAHVQGSGSFFRHHGSIYIVTAAHVINGLDVTSLAIPLAPLKNVPMRKIGNCTVFHPVDDEVDVAMVRIDDESFIKDVVINWHVLNLHNEFNSNATIEDYIIAGHPVENIKTIDGNLVPEKFFQLYTGEYTGEVQGEVESHHLMLRYSEIARDVNDNSITSPKVEGASGAPVWALVEPMTSIWSPETILKLVGVQSAYLPKKYIRVMRWCIVKEILQKSETKVHNKSHHSPH